MNTLTQLGLLSQNQVLETDGNEAACPEGYTHNPAHSPFTDIPITEAVMPNGRTIKLLKTMVTSACERNCYYCPFRAGRDLRRATLSPDELSKTFITLKNAGVVEGLFLSSGIIGGGVRTQDKLIDTADILRHKYQFKGYLHLKIMPGAEHAQVERAMQLASRISINLEAPNTARLHMLAPKKEFTSELLTPLIWAEQIRNTLPPTRTWNGRWPSSTTQLVVGAVGESDLEILSISEKLYKTAGLQRTYFSRFTPIKDTPFEDRPAENPLRQNRLYQSSYLLRDYGFDLEEFAFDQGGFLSLTVDPKLAWAQAHLAENPIDINQADYQRLIRVPGIGPKNATRIINARRKNKISSLAALRKIGIPIEKASPFILLLGKRPAYQASFL